MAHSYYHHHKPSENDCNFPGVLDVILVVSNTRRYESRYRLFKKIMHRLEQTPNVRLTVVEMAFAHRPHAIGHHHNHRNLLLRSHDELWHKEQMINLGIKRLPHDWQYVCWYDADVEMINDDWALETIEALQHYQVVQPWSHAIDLGPEGEMFNSYTSFCSCFVNGKIPKDRHTKPYYAYPHSGYVWAARREAINHLGGLIDIAILGAGDHHMAWGLIGRIIETAPKGINPVYLRHLQIWQDRAMEHIKMNIGYVPGTLCHYWHGKKRDRKYVPRWKILIDNDYNPDMDLTKDWQGLWTLRVETPRQISLRDAIRFYMTSRNEDSIDME